MNLNFSNRLSYKLARNTVLVTLLIGLVLNLAQVVFDYTNQKDTFYKDIQSIIAISHAPASQIAYNIDSQLADELLQGLLKHPAIIEAEIIDSDNRILAKQSRKIKGSAYRWLSNLLFDPTHTFSNHLSVKQLPNVDLGSLNVTVDTSTAGTIFIKRAIFTIMAGFAKSLILAFFLLFLFYLMLTQPLLKVINSIIDADPETPEKARLPIPKGHQQDEIGILVESTNLHLQSIEKNLQRIRQAESRLKNYSEQLELIVDTRTHELSDKNDQLVNTNKKLIIAKEEAVNRARARANFLANMSHEIRTPFNGVLGMISLTLEDPLNERQKRQLEVAYNSGIALLELLNDILDISKVEAGKLTLEDISFDLRGTVEDVANLLTQNAYAKNIDLLIDIDPSFPEKVFGDPTRTRQIINNLTGNAIKFTERGYVLLSLHIEHSNIIISIRDTGIGINKNDIDKIFAPFSQAYSDTTRKFGGTGLGLTLCRQLITEMGGILEVESEEKVGSAFTAKLPLKQDTALVPFPLELELLKISVVLVQYQPLQHIPIIYKQLQYWGISTVLLKCHELKHLQWPVDRIKENPIIILDDANLVSILPDSINQNRVILLSHKPPASLSLSTLHFVAPPLNRTLLHQTLCKVINKERTDNSEPDIETPNRNINEISILLVEDNKVNQMVAKTILKKIGYKVSLAANGEEAIKLIQSKSFDVVLMDCHMPIMDGYKATEIIRHTLKMPNLPIIAVTANVMHGDKEKCSQSGMDDYISKPYKKAALLQIIEKWVNT